MDGPESGELQEGNDLSRRFVLASAWALHEDSHQKGRGSVEVQETATRVPGEREEV